MDPKLQTVVSQIEKYVNETESVLVMFNDLETQTNIYREENQMPRRDLWALGRRVKDGLPALKEALATVPPAESEAVAPSPAQ